MCKQNIPIQQKQVMVHSLIEGDVSDFEVQSAWQVFCGKISLNIPEIILISIMH
jgi:hypothetical protein